MLNFAWCTYSERVRWRRSDPAPESLSDLLRSLPAVAVAGFLLGAVGSWVKPVPDVESIVDRLEFGAVCAGFFLLIAPLVFGGRKLWDFMWSRAGF